MKDIDKMSEQELRAEVRVLRPVFEAAKRASSIMGYHRPADICHQCDLHYAIAAVEAQDDGEMQAAALSEIDR